MKPEAQHLNDGFKVKIVFEDQHLLVLSKPAGLLSQGEKKGDPNLVDWLRDYLGRYYIGLIHRLDRNTSGLMVAAKRTKSAARLTTALQEGKIRRVYHAWLCGKLAGPALWRHWLIKDENRNQVRAFHAPRADAKEAVLSIRPLRYVSPKSTALTLAEVVLETGRSHQVRVQCALEGYPLAGDLKYGKKTEGPCLNLIGRPALHSAVLEFSHPMSGECCHFEEELPADMKQLGSSMSRKQKRLIP